MSDKKRFSQLYIERGAPLPDSPKFRVRLAQYLGEYGYDHCNQLAGELTKELGIESSTRAVGAAALAGILKSADVHDVLDSVTVIYDYFGRATYDPAQSTYWMEFVRRVFVEVNLAYVVDDSCVVHPLIDREFSRNIASAIASLGIPRYEGARHAFEAAEAKLEQTPADFKGAIRDTFEAAETLTKLISASGKALTSGFVRSELELRVQRLYKADAVATAVGTRLCQSFGDWCDAAHPSRHGQKVEDPVSPPDELAVLLVSQGASFVRWLVDLDVQTNESSS